MKNSDLIAAAKSVRMNAYAPYSVYRVGAAILGADGTIYTGCNVENVSFGATICAEQVAIGKMVAAGCLEWTSLVIISDDGGSPCGICRQVLAEFGHKNSDPIIEWMNPDEGHRGSSTLSQLLPNAFTTNFPNEKSP